MTVEGGNLKQLPRRRYRFSGLICSVKLIH